MSISRCRTITTRSIGALAVVAATLTVGSSAEAAPGDPATIDGIVFRDYDFNGVADAGEPGEEGVTVTAICELDGDNDPSTGGTDALTDSTVTGADGSYSLDVPEGHGCRLEATDWPSYLLPGANGSDNGSTVQFIASVAAGSNPGNGIGLVNPADFCDANPAIVTTCFVFGAYDGPNTTYDSVAGSRWTAGGNSGPLGADYGLGTASHNASVADTGTTYGAAWRRSSGSLFTAAFMKNYSGFGPSGTGAIYTTTISPSTGTTSGASSLWLDINTLPGVNTCTDPHGDDLVPPGSPGTPPAGTAGFPALLTGPYAAVGKCAMGDIEVSDDESTLFVTNLSKTATSAGQILAIDIDSKTLVGGSPWEIPTDQDNCPNPVTDVHSGALAYDDGALFAGLVCGADSSGDRADLRMYVYEVDPLTGSFSEVLDAPFDYNRLSMVSWQAWSNDPTDVAVYTQRNRTKSLARYPQPWLVDLGVVGNEMTIGVRDRAGDQGPWYAPDLVGGVDRVIAGGDLLCAHKTGAAWALESAGACGSDRTKSGGGEDGGGPGGSEFFEDGSDGHHENSFGGVAMVPGFDDVAHTAHNPQDPFSDWNDTPAGTYSAAGFMYNSLGDGSTQRAFLFFDRTSGGSGTSSGEPFFGKANGLGDVEALCSAAPIEIGNYVWFDADGDGIQDPSEAPVVGATVSLYAGDGTTLIASTTTDANGQYYFNVSPSTDYVIRMNNALDYEPSGPLEGWSLTVAGADADDDADSDATRSTSGGYPEISYTSGLAGHNDHTLDIGFTEKGESFSVGNRVWIDADNDGSFTTGEEVVAGVAVELFADSDGDGHPDDLNGDGVIDGNDAVATTTTDADGLYLFDNLAAGDYIVGIPPSQTATGQPLDGHESSTPTSSDPNDDVDDDDNGFLGPDGYIVSGPVTLGDGEPTGEAVDNDQTTPDANENLTVDFGFYIPTETFSVGNRVWIDADNDGSFTTGEEVVAGVAVELFADSDGDGHPDDLNGDGVIDGNDAVATTTTDADGLYLFDNLAAGDYIVGIPPTEWDQDGPLHGTLSSGPTSSDPNDDVDDDDNGFLGPDGYIVSGPVTLGDGEPTGEAVDNDQTTPDANENLTVDFGFWEPAFDLALYKQLADGTNSAAVDRGDLVTFTFTITNQGNITASDIGIVDYVPAGLTLADADWTTRSDGNAYIQISGPPLQPGDITTIDITFEVTSTFDSISNLGEIYQSSPTTADGLSIITMPNGQQLPDIDSIADASAGDKVVDDQIDDDGTTDEDDHDIAQLTMGGGSSTGTLPWTGTSAGLVALAGILLASMGALLTRGSRAQQT